MKRLVVIGALAIAAMLGFSSTSSAWTEEDCRKVNYQHPDCKTPSPSPTKSPTPKPSVSPTKTPAPTEPPRIPPTRPPFTVAPSPTPSPTLIPPVTTTPRPKVQGITTLPNTSTR